LADLLVVERPELTETAAVREHGDQDVDEEADKAQATATDGDSPGPNAATAGIGDLARVEGSITAKAHGGISCLVSHSANRTCEIRSSLRHFR
jgi:hypothetical protein